MDIAVVQKGLAPFSLKGAPALIERVFPAQKVGVESQKERKANTGQTLTVLGAYWKGRKPLVLVRATILASLLPATDDPEGDLELFEMLMRMDADGLLRRKPKVTPDHVWASPAIAKDDKLEHVVAPVGPAVTEDADADEAEDGEAEEAETSSRKGTAKWRPIDLSRFDMAIAEAKADGKTRLATDQPPSSDPSKMLVNGLAFLGR